MRAVLAVVLLSLVAVLIAKKVDFTLCLDNPPFTITDIDVQPDSTVKPGETITATINGVSKVLVTGGTLLSDISLDGVPILETKYDLCSVGVGCPIKPGPYHVTVTQQVTELAPPGSYQSKNQAFDLQGNRLSCVMINFTVSG